MNFCAIACDIRDCDGRWCEVETMDHRRQHGQVITENTTLRTAVKAEWGTPVKGDLERFPRLLVLV